MILPAYGVVPTSRLEARLQLLNIDEAGHLDVLYEPSLEDKKPLVAVQRCRNCGAMIMNKSAVYGELWICGICDSGNMLVEKPSSESYTVRLDENPQAGPEDGRTRPIILVIDRNEDAEGDVARLTQVLADKLAMGPPRDVAIVTIGPDGTVEVHHRHGGDVSDDLEPKNLSVACFHAHDSTTVDAAEKLDLEFFKSRLSAGIGPIFFNESDAAKIVTGLVSTGARLPKSRHQRATGLSLVIAAALAQTATFALTVACLSGPCTIGPGKVVPKNLKYAMRQHHDLDKSSDKYFRKARTFFERLSTQNECQMLIGCLDQIGFVELAPVCNSVGQFDSFSSPGFELALETVLNSVAWGSEITIKASKGLLVDGCYGDVQRLPPTQKIYSDTPCGVSGTNKWQVAPATPSLAFRFSIETAATKEQSIDSVPQFLILQFQFSYFHQGEKRCRIETIFLPTTNHQSANSTSIQDTHSPLASLACLMKRIAFSQLRLRKFHSLDLERWREKLDRIAAAHFHQQSHTYMVFIDSLYHLKWSALLQKRNTSPDEACIFQSLVLSWTANHCKLLCKPLVTIFEERGPIDVEIIDEQLIFSRNATCVDGGNFILVRYAERDSMAQNAVNYGVRLVETRFPPPVFKETVVGGSQDRYFVSKLAPRTGLNTEDASFNEYIDSLRKIR
ncbi:LAMI_0D04280g1_1 [Lachancea mirantina]|uniref:Protein transport protein SEC23 n=1 Tax=Lachancea mirantina TaxID=1230905 RepID=A0A1G4JAE9_9SACH|nr:LAMI_0D04280g1_1 [Lachancea mirantina]